MHPRFFQVLYVLAESELTYDGEGDIGGGRQESDV